MDNDAINRTLNVIEEITRALNAPHTLDEGLRLVVDTTCKLLDTTQAAVLLLDEGRQLFIVRAATGLEGDIARVGFPLEVPDNMQKLLLKIQHIHSISGVDSGIDGIRFPIITTPLFYKGNRIGLLFGGGARDPQTANEPLRMKLFSLLAPFASLIIENGRANDIINRRFLANTRQHMEAVLEEERPAPPAKDVKALPIASDQVVSASISNPAKVVKMLTEAFYRELTTAGFDDSQVTIAATHLIDCILHRGKPPREE